MNLPPSVPTRFGVSSSIRFSVVSGNLRRQDRRASLGKTHHLPASRPASCRFNSPDIRPHLVTSARPPPQHHIAGSLFATYPGSASCFLQTSHLWQCPCLVGVVLPSGNGGPYCPRLRLELRPVRHARHTSNTTRRAGGMMKAPRGAIVRALLIAFAPDVSLRLPGPECTAGSSAHPVPLYLHNNLGPKNAAP